ncbi:MAG TPA: hypothetical protein VKB57_23710 [Acidimicrobiales bacterium]|nr:hypothetical protein [Acidimicrobiales bacterium]
MTPWKSGDRCRLINLRAGEVLPGQVIEVGKAKLVVQTDDGRRWAVEPDSTFLRRPTSIPSGLAEQHETGGATRDP